MTNPQSTAASDEREAVWSLVFDMDDTITRLQANLRVLEELTKSYQLAGATTNQMNVDWTLGKVVDTTDELRTRFDNLFEAAKPSAAKREAA